jgi:hypothetical protein
VSDIQREWQAILGSVKENYFHGIAWRRWQPKFSKLRQHLFFYLVGNFPINLV